jgi:hypothetical protein
VVALLSRVTSLNPINSLALSGIANLLLFLVGFRLFIGCFYQEHQDSIAFYALLFVLFLWPSATWVWSGFFHFGVLGYVLPYPSSFAGAATFLLIALHNRNLLDDCGLGPMAAAIGSPSRFIVSVVLFAAIILAHPTTAPFACAGIVAVSVQHYAKGAKVIVKGLLLTAVTGALVALWPHFSLIALIRANTPEFHAESHVFYTYLWGSAKPVLLLAPIAIGALVHRIRRNHFDGMALLMLITLAIYLFGYFTKQYGFGRIISYLAILVQINLAQVVCRIESGMRKGKPLYAVPFTMLILMIVMMNYNKASLLDKAYKGLRGAQTSSYEAYEFLSRYVGMYDVVLANLADSWMIPTFSGKVVASQHPVHWVDDVDQRRSDVARFFAGDTPPNTKRAIIEKYDVSYLLIRKEKQNDLAEFRAYGNPVHENDRFVLLKRKPFPPKPFAVVVFNGSNFDGTSIGSEERSLDFLDTASIAGQNLTTSFSLRATACVKVTEPSTLSLAVTSDDGSRVFVDGNLFIDNWGLHGMVKKESSKELSVGIHEVVIEFYQGVGPAGLKVEGELTRPNRNSSSIYDAFYAPKAGSTSCS